MSLDRASVRRSCERDATSVTQPDFIFLDAVSERRFSSPLRGSANMIVRLAVICLLLATSAGLAEDSEPSPLERDGRALAERMCSECHAIDKSGQSPHVGAPAFRALDRRVDLDTFMDRLREGLMVGHPDMPTFRFTREDARALLLYLRSIQAP
jgi:mono/diheme cytochrome c family protein